MQWWVVFLEYWWWWHSCYLFNILLWMKYQKEYVRKWSWPILSYHSDTYVPGRTKETCQTLKSIACVWAEIWNTGDSHSVMTVSIEGWPLHSILVMCYFVLVFKTFGTHKRQFKRLQRPLSVEFCWIKMFPGFFSNVKHKLEVILQASYIRFTCTCEIYG